ncbi:GTP-binding protein 1 [Gracilariopsis chorda]|uniref:GTP-binding protein 1 n=1 Tax=Gracilariopsis chorda TaxID=448386 RepID=A0A2V3IJV3_9FLOR|nr:GTP-binding protein 1 [Gracilariopsis chorda]|eukprot:PXF42328.1 GTP-binding protein 1 [Gracilariopsis chorda]
MASTHDWVSSVKGASGDRRRRASASTELTPAPDRSEVQRAANTAPTGDLAPEDDEGFIEYKWSLVSPSRDRFAQLVTQLNFRLSEGNGEAIYELGVEDNGTKKGLSPDRLAASLKTLTEMAHELGAETQVLREADGKQGRVAQVLVRKVPKALEDYVDIRIAVAGNVDSGKSTLVGVLTGTGALDNGRGLARSQIFTHKHEMETGRTSTVSQAIIGFDSTGSVVNYTDVRHLTWSDVVEKASKVLTFFDLAGHERYLKTTVFGLTAHAPDYCMLVVGANMGVLRMTKEHLAITLALKVPVYIVVTKIDLAPEQIYNHTLTTLQRILKSPSAGRKLPVLVKSMDEVTLAAQNIVNDRVVPIFSISNVTGEGLHLLRSFLNLVPSRRNWRQHMGEPAEFAIDETFVVPGVGTVVAGTTTAGAVSLGQVLNLGPDGRGKFIRAQVKSVHYKRTPVKRVVAGQAGSLALKKVKRSAVRKGMVLLDASVRPGAVREFTAEVLVLYHGTTIREGYEPVLHCETIRQAARVLSIDSPIIRTGDRAVIKFRFMYHPEYVKVGARFIFREGRTKGLGKILSVDSTQQRTST